jgi:hypothetical protein
MPGCVLRASGGESFVPAEFVSGFPLANVSPKHPVLIVPVGDSDGDDFHGQVRDALQFLGKHESAIKHLLAQPRIVAGLDFGVWSKESWCQSLSFPAELVAMAGSFGLSLEVSMYAAS